MEHFVLTRFNVATPGRESPIRNAPGWLERRFELFERFCLPSMAAQVESDFRWLIFFDRDTPARFRDRISDAAAKAPINPLFVPPGDLTGVAETVARLLDPGTRRVVTTRLDNDDAVARDYLARVRQMAASVDDGTAINFPVGLALRDDRLFTARDESNPFVSVVEAARDLRTVWSAPHRNLGAEWNLVQVETEPCWLQVVHGENVANRISGRRLLDDSALDTFAIEPRCIIERPALHERPLEALVRHPLRRLRELAIDAARPLRDRLRRLLS